MIIGASAIGSSHIDMNMPCQDSFGYRTFDNKWNLIVVSDGAGTNQYSDVGSQMFVEHVIRIISEELEELTSNINDEVLSRKSIIDVLFRASEAIKKHAADKELDFKDFGGTCLLALFTDTILYAAHIGDGRMGFRNDKGNWSAVTVPFVGEHAGETVFFTSQIWKNPSEYIQTRLIKDVVISAVVVITDGAESFSWRGVELDEEKELYEDVNIPFTPFLDGNINALKSQLLSPVEKNEVERAWVNYLTDGDGLDRIKDEPDDKTIVIAFKI